MIRNGTMRRWRSCGCLFWGGRFSCIDGLGSPLQGLDSGFAGGEDETYNVYSQPWRSSKEVAQAIYRPKNNDSEMYTTDIDTLMKTNR